MLLMGLDIGTTSVKASLFTPEGTCVALNSATTQVDVPKPGFAQQDAVKVFDALCQVIKKTVQSANDQIAALAVSVQGDAIVPVDEQFVPLTPVQLGMDYRCSRQAEKFEQEFGGQALFQRTGMVPHPLNSLCKIRHIVEESPEVAAHTRWYMTYSDYVLARLGVEQPVIDESMASRTMGWNLQQGRWDEELVKAAGIDLSQLSRPVRPGVAVGRINRRLAQEMGINPEAVLVTGGHDQVCAAVGAGLGSAGMALDSHGTAEVISTVLPQPVLSGTMSDAGFPCYRFADDGSYFTFTLNHVSGLLLSEFVREYCAPEQIQAKQTGASVYDLLLSRVSEQPSQMMVLPYVNGRGTPLGDTGARGLIAGITLNSTRADMARAILEGLAFDMCANLAALKAANVPVTELRCVGGGAKSALGLQIKADITGREVTTLRQNEAACLGAAILAGVASGEYQSVEQARHIVQVDRIYAPNALRHAFYTERYNVYEQLYRATRSITGAL